MEQFAGGAEAVDLETCFDRFERLEVGEACGRAIAVERLSNPPREKCHPPPPLVDAAEPELLLEPAEKLRRAAGDEAEAPARAIRRPGRPHERDLEPRRCSAQARHRSSLPPAIGGRSKLSVGRSVSDRSDLVVYPVSGERSNAPSILSQSRIAYGLFDEICSGDERSNEVWYVGAIEGPRALETQSQIDLARRVFNQFDN